jgi:hypothetical protein
MQLIRRVKLPVVNPPGTLAQRPANGSQPDGSEFYATNDNGGQRYVMVAGLWQKRGPAVGDASGKSLGYAELANTWNPGNWSTANQAQDIPGLTFGFNSSVRPFRIEAEGALQLGLGSVASGSVIRGSLQIAYSTDGGSTWTPAQDSKAFTAKVATGETWLGNVRTRSTLIVPPASGTAYVVKAMLAIATVGPAPVMFARNLGSTTSIEVVER